MDSNGVRILVDLLTLAHLHTSRATVPLQVENIAAVVIELHYMKSMAPLIFGITLDTGCCNSH